MQIVTCDDVRLMERCAAQMAATDPWKRFGRSPLACQDAFVGPGKVHYVALRDGELLGFAVVQTIGAFQGYVQTLCVCDGHRGQGVGTALLQHCEEEIFRYSPNVFMCVSSFNERALKLYLSLGFQKIGELENFVIEGASEFLLRKTRGPKTGYKP